MALESIIACLELQNLFSDLLSLPLKNGNETPHQVVEIKLHDICKTYFVNSNHYRSVCAYFLSKAWFIFISDLN